MSGQSVDEFFGWGNERAMIHFRYQDYDWADEVLHAQIGRKWLLAAQDMSRDEVVKIGQQKAIESESALSRYMDRGDQFNWWPDFVRKALGHETAMQNFELVTADPVYRNASS